MVKRELLWLREEIEEQKVIMDGIANDELATQVMQIVQEEHGDGDKSSGAGGPTSVPFPPPTCSPITMANLLPEVREGVQERMPPVELVVAIELAFASGRDRSPAAVKIELSDETGDDAPAGSQSFSRRAGTDVRWFRHAPDPSRGGR